MTEETQSILERVVGVLILSIVTYIGFRFWFLPETGLVWFEDGVWMESNTVFPYTSELGFWEWPLPIQRAFIAILSGLVIGAFIVVPILNVIWNCLVLFWYWATGRI